MNVVLVSPPSITDELDGQREPSDQDPLGVLTLAAVLEKCGIDSQIVDLNRLYSDYLSAVQARSIDFFSFATDYLTSLSFDFCGFSTISSTYPFILRLARELKRAHPDRPLLLGGPQASVVDVPTLEAFPFVDLIVRGEAEEILPEALSALPDAGALSDIPGLTYRSRAGIVRNPNAPVIVNLDTLPMPAFHLYPKIAPTRRVSLELGRGCPFACEFCSTNDFFRRRFRVKSPEVVIGQMRSIHRTYGSDRFDLVHDMFTVDRKKVVAFCEAMIASGEKFYWNCTARTDCIDDELIALMAKAGCVGIFFGIETGSSRLQRVINKNLDLREAADRIRSSASHRMSTAVSMISGFPEETLEDLRATVAFLVDAARIDHTKPQFNILAPLAETPIHARHRHRLLLEESLFDVSYDGWPQEQGDRELIRKHPAIFPDFYVVPTPNLDIGYVKELRDFVLNCMRRFRWLLVALHQVSGDLLSVFDEWRDWIRSKDAKVAVPYDDSSPYYTRIEFRDKFLEFVRTKYLEHVGAAARALSALVEFETMLGFAGDAETSRRPEALQVRVESRSPLEASLIPRPAKGVRLGTLGADLKTIIRRLRSNECLDTVPGLSVAIAIRENRGSELEVLQLSVRGAQVLSLCDGLRSVEEIARRYVADEGPMAGVTPRDCLDAIEGLRQHGLIEVNP